MDAGYTQTQLANEIGNVHSQFVSNWERGLCAPPSHSLPRLINILKLQPEKLVEVMVADSKIEIEKKIYAKRQTRRKKAV